MILVDYCNIDSSQVSSNGPAEETDLECRKEKLEEKDSRVPEDTHGVLPYQGSHVPGTRAHCG